MKKMAMFLAGIMLISSVSEAFVTRTITITKEKVIPFSFVSDSCELEESLNIKGLTDVKIKDMYVDNGKIRADISGNYIEVDFSEGEWANSYKTISRVDSLELNKATLTDVTNKIIVVSPDREVKSIQSVSGDFKEAKLRANGDIEITVDSLAEGTMSFDEDSLIKSSFIVQISDENLDRECEDTIVLPYKVQGDITPKSGDTSSVEEIYVDGNEVTVRFNNGVPVPNETTVKSGYTFFWIDRNEEGLFKPYNPNGIYSTDINKVTGLGEYIDEFEFDEIGLTVNNDKWSDYCGFYKDGVRYILVFDENRGVPEAFSDSLVEDNIVSFNEQNFNSEKYTVKLSNAGVSYIPEGKLYSMGELISGTNGWGETEPNRDWESTKTFLNEITGKYETYVKHFKFFYGPDKKTTFGGYYTYPYSCTFEYEHYKPVRCFSGDIVYEYESTEKVKGYSYNGWIKIEYKTQKEINDYPPTAPYNVRYNKFTGDINWGAGSDDYTDTKDLMYEIEIFDGAWKNAKKGLFEELKTTYKIDYSEPDVRIRTIDGSGQLSSWSYALDSQIELNGELKPYIVKAGESIDIFANTKSLEKIQSVVAKNTELQMYTELQKVEESTPSFMEMSYDIEIDFPEYENEFLTIANGRVALGNKEILDNYKFAVSKEYDKGYVDFDIIEDVKMKEKGSIVFSNLNYSNIPVDMFKYDSKTWFVSWNNVVYIKNKVTNKEDKLFVIESDPKTEMIGYRSVIVPYYRLCVNKFNYDENGKPTYEYIDVDKNILSRPFTLTWNTDVSGVTSFYAYFGNELIYTYEALWEDINKHVDNVNSIYMYKQMKKYAKATYGYINPSTTTKAKWNKIVLSLVPKHDLRGFTWLGYRVRNNEYVKQEYVDEFNSNVNVLNNYRLLISYDIMSYNAIKRYTDILKTTNTAITKDKSTISGDDVMEYTSRFEGLKVKIPANASSGNYEIELTATDVDGNTACLRLTLIVQAEKEEIVEDEITNNKENEDNTNKEASIVEQSFGRFFYKDGKGFLEELKKVEDSNISGFICAGETLGLVLVTENVDFIEVDFLGNESIKTLDSLTKHFLIDIPKENGKDTTNIEYQYMNFPKKIYPQYVDNSGIQVFKWFYVVPYGTEQSLESWSSLKDDTLENIDISSLFDRITEPYSVVIYPNGDMKKAIHLNFDVFERWDTVLNRDITKYVINSDSRWEMRIDK